MARARWLADIQRLKIENRFDFRAVGHVKANDMKQPGNALQRQRHRVQTTPAAPRPEQGDVNDSAASWAAIFGSQRVAAGVKGGFKRLQFR